MKTRLAAQLVGLAALVAPRAAIGAELIVLGIAQDAGVPQAGCTRACCADALADPSLSIEPSCVAVVEDGRRYLFDAPPTLGKVLARLDELAPAVAERSNRNPALAGIFLTHAHIGHYAGLMHLGREVMGAEGVVVHAMPRMASFLESSGPWSQLVELGNVRVEVLAADLSVELSTELRVTPWRVPHRDEYSETVGYLIEGPQRRVLYLPDINKWSLWERSLAEVLTQLDRVYVDGSFFDVDELPGRAIEEVPHPLIRETLALVADLGSAQRAKLRFIHLNHTNPALRAGSARDEVLAAGCGFAAIGERYEL